ncbi:MAG TPA: glycosyltransferase family 4 protein [Candidatus Saccharimonadales bacterium]|nr:glycosyltransferase family 4 protein [Candidatus Saccharimonadales bacterium]
MKIGQLVNNLDVSGGYQKLVIRFTQSLQKQGHEVVVYTPGVDKKKCYPNDIKDLTIVTLNNNEKTLPHIKKYETMAAKIAPNLDALVIHDDISLIALPHLPKNGMTIAWMLNNQLPENLGKYHKELFHLWKNGAGQTKDKLRDIRSKAKEVRLMRQGLKRVSIFATYDKFNQKLVQSKLHRKADFVAAGADLERFKAYASGRSFKDKKRYELLSVGVVFPHRRYEDVIEAVAQLREQKLPVHATIVGLQDLSVHYFETLQKLVKDKGLEKNITFKHYVTDDEMTKLYKQSDVFLFINDGFTWGISVFEAVAAGLPVIITNNIGAADLVEDGKTGWVVNPRSPKEVAAAVKEIITKRSKAEKIANKAEKELATFVSWDAYTKRMLKLIKAKR